MTLRVVLWHRAVPRRRTGPSFDAEASGAAASWARYALGAAAAAHDGVVVGAIASAVAVVFPEDRAEGAMETAARHLAAAAAAGRPVALGLAVGTVDERDGGLSGQAFDRAQALAGRAGPGEALVHRAIAVHASARWTFRRRRRAGGLRGLVLAPPGPEAVPAAAAEPWADALERVRDVAMLGGVHRVALRVPLGAPTDEVVAALRPEDGAFVWRLPGATGGFEPLGTLRRGLVSALGPPGQLREAAGIPPDDAALLVAIAEGQAVDREETVQTLRRLVGGWGRDRPRPWIVWTDPASTDGASLDALARATADGVDALLLVLVEGDEAAVPPALAAWGPFAEVRLAPRPGAPEGERWRERAAERLAALAPEARRALEAFATIPPALAVELCAGDGSDVLDALRRAGWLGASSEPASPAHRALVAERVDPETRHALSARALDRLEWLEEALPPGAFGRAEAGWLALSSGRRGQAARELMAVASVAAGHRFHRAATELAVLALRADASPEMQEAARAVARQADEAARESQRPPARGPSVPPPPTRPSERRRRAERPGDPEPAPSEPSVPGPPPVPADAATAEGDEDSIAGWRSAPPAGPPPGRATPPETPAVGSLPAPDDLDDLLDDDDDVDTIPPTGRLASAPARRAATLGKGEHLDALRRGDQEALERLLEDARARGVDPAAVERLSGLALLLRGEVAAAVEHIDRDTTAGPRPLLTRSVAALVRRDLDGAVRLAAEALLRAREAADREGIRASLRALEACYRALGRDAQAERLRMVTQTT